MRQLLEEWKAAPRGDRTAEAALWKRLSAARNAFAKRRKAYFANLEEEREGIRARKEDLAQQAEALSASTDWGGDGDRLPGADAVLEDTRAGPTGPPRTSCGTGSRRPRTRSSRPAPRCWRPRTRSCTQHAVVKEQLLAEAEKLLPVSDLRAARASLRGIQERWEKAGAVPRDSQDRLEGGLRRIEESMRKAEDTQWRRSNPEAPEPGPQHGRPAQGHDQPARATARQGRGDRRRARHSSRPRKPSPPASPGWPKPSAPWPSSPADADAGLCPQPHPPGSPGSGRSVWPASTARQRR